MTDSELQSLAYGMTGGASRSADAAAELRRRERRDAAIDRESEPHRGHFSRHGGTWWCDTCDSPYCDLA